jgi:membrane protein implicated in regulation of membrane protease activity
MNIKRLSVAFAVVSFLPLLAHAQTGEASGGSSLLANMLWSVAPFVIIGVLFYFFFVPMIRKNKTRSDDYIASQKQHNERVEQILERIAKALEQKGKDVV